MEQRITLVTPGVSDLKKSRDFYEKKFGWTPLPARMILSSVNCNAKPFS